ncbi:EAL domain-containing protein [Limoniibacter endophyticus]|uniref:cyclic-guanylate-specific phosphodiesterase n=1 Tax=Limoniibacter endophyticus TaxID=1565040 RepID=A0A8J3GG09_9HYPH|nr:EAL domain-containing protein [Limoniibacter endophyticus]GHC61789.1 cyclic diguanylate phosphodiesterase [Limoniibacter endophyticus]
MRRSKVLLLGSILAFGAIVLPLAVTSYLAWRIADRYEEASLSGYAQLALQRATTSLAEIGKVLEQMNALEFETCSQQHIAAMRLATINNVAVDEIGYLNDQRFVCTSWGEASHLMSTVEVDFVLNDDLQGNIDVRPLGGYRHNMIALRNGRYNVLFDPRRLADVTVAEGDVGVAISHANGTLLSIGGNHDDDMREAVRRVLMQESDSDHRGSVAAEGDIVAIAIASKPPAFATVLEQGWIILPLSLALSALGISAITAMSRRQLSLASELASAIRRKKLSVHYQPVIDLKTGDCVGAEALVRWFKSNGTSVRPDIFVDVAEETGQIRALTDLVIETTMRELGPAMRRDRSLHVAINLSADDVSSGRFLPILERILARYDVLHEQIWLEATERGFPEMEAVRETVAKARALGFKIAIDDFGTGYSSLSYIESIRLDALKIDKSFIDSIGQDLATSSVTPHIIDMAKSLDLITVAEGIETREQLNYLEQHGVALGQGWLFAKAMPARDFVAFVAAHRKKISASGTA